MAKHNILKLNFGFPEAEDDELCLTHSFYETNIWNQINSKHPPICIIGRKGSGKSALITRLLLEKKDEIHTIKIHPSEMQHIEIHSLLSKIDKSDGDVEWKYIYEIIWEGVLIYQIANFICNDEKKAVWYKLSTELKEQCSVFLEQCKMYSFEFGTSIVEILEECAKLKYIESNTITTIRKAIKPYNWDILLKNLSTAIKSLSGDTFLRICIDGLDDKWSISKPSLSFISQAINSVKKLHSRFSPGVLLTLCLRDNIFRTLMQSNYIEFDKISPFISHLRWSNDDLLRLISLRAFPGLDQESSLVSFKSLFPQKIQGKSLEVFLGNNLLNRPRDYINYFLRLQVKISPEFHELPESEFMEFTENYSEERLNDLENEYSLTYPGLSKIVMSLCQLPEIFTQAELLRNLSRMISLPQERAKAPLLFELYPESQKIAVILFSVGVIGYHENGVTNYISEYNESQALLSFRLYNEYCIHPAYSLAITSHEHSDTNAVATKYIDPVEQSAESSNPPKVKTVMKTRGIELTKDLSSIPLGVSGGAPFEKWGNQVLSFCFANHLMDSKTQIPSQDGTKRFENIFIINGDKYPWSEMENTFNASRILVEYKNKKLPTDADVSKLERDLKSLNLPVALIIYRSEKHEPEGNFVKQIKSVFDRSKLRIIGITSSFLIGCLSTADPLKIDRKFSTLWRLHLETYFAQ